MSPPYTDATPTTGGYYAPVEEDIDALAKAIASALRGQSRLRHALFTPNEFARLCEPVIRRVLREAGPLKP